jgi:hypothetical protein
MHNIDLWKQILSMTEDEYIEYLKKHAPSEYSEYLELHDAPSECSDHPKEENL